VQSVAKTAATDKRAAPAAHPAAFAFSDPDFLTAARVARAQEVSVGSQKGFGGSAAVGSSDLPRSLNLKTRCRARVRNKREATKQDIGSAAPDSGELGASKGSSRGSIRLAWSQRQAARAAHPALNRERMAFSQLILPLASHPLPHLRFIDGRNSA
jgi:hypothetical protein